MVVIQCKSCGKRILDKEIHIILYANDLEGVKYETSI